MNVIIRICFILLIFVCAKGLLAQTNIKLVYDTTTIAIIDLDKKDVLQKFYIDTSCKPSVLSQGDLKIIDSILKSVMIEKKLGDTMLLNKKSQRPVLDSIWKAMKLISNEQDALYKQADSLSKPLFYQKYYIKQYLPYQSKDEERFVFVNIMYCSSIICGENWKKELCIYSDGGNCCFRFKINLSTYTYFNFEVNETGG